MSVIFLLIPLSIIIAICFLVAFIWAVRSGQYEDTCTPSMRLLLEDMPEQSPTAHLKAMAERTGLIRKWNLFLEQTPLVLAPVSTELPYTHGFDLESAARTAEVWRQCTTLMAVPVLGLPGMAVPTGLAEGLPVGVQIVGRYQDEWGLLQMANAFEQAIGEMSKPSLAAGA